MSTPGRQSNDLLYCSTTSSSSVHIMNVQKTLGDFWPTSVPNSEKEQSDGSPSVMINKMRSVSAPWPLGCHWPLRRSQSRRERRPALGLAPVEQRLDLGPAADLVPRRIVQELDVEAVRVVHN